MKKTSFLLLTILCLAFGRNATAQSHNEKIIADIKYKYLELAEFPKYQVKRKMVLDKPDADDGKSYFKGEVEGYYRDLKLCILKEYTKLPQGKMTREFYLYEGKLIFVYEKTETREAYTDENGQARKKLSVDYECSYYFHNNKLIKKNIKKGKAPYDKEMSGGDIRELFIKLLADYEKQLEAVKPGQQ